MYSQKPQAKIPGVTRPNKPQLKINHLYIKRVFISYYYLVKKKLEIKGENQSYIAQTYKKRNENTCAGIFIFDSNFGTSNFFGP